MFKMELKLTVLESLCSDPYLQKFLLGCEMIFSDVTWDDFELTELKIQYQKVQRSS